jgi:hypothetical protein
MQHPVFYLARVTKFLDSLIREDGDYLYVGFFYLCVAFVVWMFVRLRKHPVSPPQPTSVIILPFGMGYAERSPGWKDGGQD